CFLLAKALRKPAPELAAELAPRLSAAVDGVRASATGPYLNFRIDRIVLARVVVGEIERKGGDYARSDVGAGKTIVIDFSRPNIAKPMHVGHLRSTIIGAALVRLFQALGYRTVGINHLGDWGSQFGGLVVAIRRWRETVDLEREPMRGLLELYQRSQKAVETD